MVKHLHRVPSPVSRRFSLLVSLGLILAMPAHALMAGAAPDSPAARVVAPSQSAEWPGLGQVITPGGRFNGVAISRRHVLTATHVAGGHGARPTLVRFIPFGHEADERQAARIATLPGYAMPANDLAVIELATPLPRNVPVARLMRGTLNAGDVIDLVGAGASGHGDTGLQHDASPREFRWGRNVADLVGEHVPGVPTAGHFLFYDFDGPQGNGVLGGPTLGNPLETLVAGGDSGGPIYVRPRGASERLLVGISVAVISPVSGERPRFTFGSLGVGTDLTAPAVRAWLTSVTDGALQEASPQPRGPDSATTMVAVLGLALVLVALALAGWRRHAQRGGRWPG